jgi:hypothetical protein
MAKKEPEMAEKKPAGCVCILHGTFDKLMRCPICEACRAVGGDPFVLSQQKPPVRRFAFASTGNGIGRADEGTDGYTPMPEAGHFPSFEAAQERAMDWNARMGYTHEEAELIAVGTMRGQNLEDRIEKLTVLLKRGRELLIEEAGGYKALTLDQKEWADEIEEL